MRARAAVMSAVFAALSATAQAMPYIPPPQPVYEAPIDRALANVNAMDGVEAAQRERLLGRLNLLAYARNDAAFAYLRENDALNEGGSVPCNEAPHMIPPDQPQPKFEPGERCARWTFDLRPQLELPANPPPANMSAGARARLEAARDHYRRALQLDGANLRARLGYAYVLDRLSDVRGARNELRTILRQGLPRLAGEHSEWEDHAVLTEAAAHLAHLASSARDRSKLRQLRDRLQASQPMIFVTPIVVPFTDAPFTRLVDDGAPVAFDFAGTGDTRAQGWLNGNAAWLVWDPDWRGAVRSGFDMIGQRTWAVFWNDGFEALRALDDNRDGELTGAELDGLSLWRDENGNGVSEPGEVIPVNVHGIEALSVRGQATRPGLITAPNGVRFDDGSTRPLYDWTPGLERAPAAGV